MLVMAKVSLGDTKSTTQKLSDEASSATGSAKETGKSVLQQAAGALDSAQKAVAGSVSINRFLE